MDYIWTNCSILPSQTNTINIPRSVDTLGYILWLSSIKLANSRERIRNFILLIVNIQDPQFHDLNNSQIVKVFFHANLCKVDS